MRRRMRVLAVILAATVLCVPIAAQDAARPTSALTESELQEAVEWALRGDVQPYALRSFPARVGTRSGRGRVYTRRVRLARLAESAFNAGRTLELSDVPPAVAEPVVMIAWDWEPRMADSEQRGCSPFADGPIWVTVRLLDNSAPPEIQPAAVITEKTAIRQVLAPFEPDSRGIYFVAVIPPHALRPDTQLVWQTRTTCPDWPNPMPSNTPAFISADDLRRWR